MDHHDPAVSGPAGQGGGRRVRALAAGILAIFVAACGGSQGPIASPSPAGASTPGPSPEATPSPMVTTNGLSIAAILGTTADPPPATTWRRVSDPGAAFTYEVPAAWTASAAYPWVDGEATVGTVLAAGPDLTKLASDFTVPGVAIGLSANPGDLTPRQAVEADASYDNVCTAGEIQDAAEPAMTAAFQLWDACGGGSGFLLVMAIAPVEGGGLIAVIFQGAEAADLGYLEHIVGSLAAGEPVVPPTPAPSQGSVPDQPYTISMTTCLNQHGQGVSEGLIRNDDARIHVFRIEVWFFDLNGVLLNTTDWTTTEIPPGVTARWQADVPSGLPAVEVQCQLREVEVVH